MSQHGLEALVRRELPHLPTSTVGELACAVGRLIEAFAPVRVYAYGSHARGTPHTDSDLDVMVVVDQAEEPAYRLDQRGYELLEPFRLPIELFFITRDEFERRLPVAMSLPATVLREGRLLYDAESRLVERAG